jgi:hypothetical protein
MRSKRDGDTVDSLRSDEYMVEPLCFDTDALETYREFVLRSITEFAESDLGLLHQPQDDVQRLYLITGGVFRLGDSGVTRLS